MGVWSKEAKGRAFPATVNNLMKVYIANDTSWFHCGSYAAMCVLRDGILAAGHEIIGTNKVGTQFLYNKLYRNADTVVINGEGTMHHESKGKRFLMEVIRRSIEDGKNVYLYNTVWQDNKTSWDNILKKIKWISVREVSSYNELKKKHGIKRCGMALDLSYFCPIDDEDEIYDFENEVVAGDFFYGNEVEAFKGSFDAMYNLNLFHHTWSTVVNSLKTASCYVTGRHHGVYAACKARTPFAAYRSNTHKVTGLFKWAGVEIPIANKPREIPNLLSWISENKGEYERLFDWMEKHADWEFADNLD